MGEDLSAQDLLAAYGIEPEEETADEYRGVMVLAEGAGGAISEPSLGALGAAREVADALGARLEALLPGGGDDEAAALIRHGADVVLLSDAQSEYDPDQWSGALTAVIQSRKPEVVILAASDVARDIGPRVAQRLHTGLIAGAQEVRPEADERLLVGIVPLYGGRLLGEFACPDKRPQMICLAEGAGRIPSADASRQGEIERLAT